jgi:regulator of replication initiation timing
MCREEDMKEVMKEFIQENLALRMTIEHNTLEIYLGWRDRETGEEEEFQRQFMSLDHLKRMMNQTSKPPLAKGFNVPAPEFGSTKNGYFRFLATNHFLQKMAFREVGTGVTDNEKMAALAKELPHCCVVERPTRMQAAVLNGFRPAIYLYSRAWDAIFVLEKNQAGTGSDNYNVLKTCYPASTSKWFFDHTSYHSSSEKELEPLRFTRHVEQYITLFPN